MAGAEAALLSQPQHRLDLHGEKGGCEYSPRKCHRCTWAGRSSAVRLELRLRHRSCLGQRECCCSTSMCCTARNFDEKAWQGREYMRDEAVPDPRSCFQVSPLTSWCRGVDDQGTIMGSCVVARWTVLVETLNGFSVRATSMSVHGYAIYRSWPVDDWPCYVCQGDYLNHDDSLRSFRAGGTDVQVHI